MTESGDFEDQSIDLVRAARLQEKRRGAAATYANLLLIFFTLGLFWMQEPGTSHNVLFVLAYALCQLLATFLYHILPQWREDWSDRGIPADLSPGSTSSPHEDAITFERRLPRPYESLWIAALINLVGMAGLIWWTGGPVNSPFGTVLLLMIVAGQMLVRVGEVQFDDLRDLPRITVEAIKRYSYALIVALSLYGALFITQVHHHWRHSHVPPAPKGEYFLVILVNLLATTVLTYASRAGTDRFGESTLFPKRAPGTDDPPPTPG